MGNDLLWKVKEGASVKLKDYDADFTGKGIERSSAEAELQRLGEEMSELQELMASAQHQSLLAREQDIDKAWKISADDWVERQYWDDYQRAYEDALSKCSTDEAPWYIVPANHKWYRNLAIAQLLVETMSSYKNEWKSQLE